MAIFITLKAIDTSGLFLYKVLYNSPSIELIRSNIAFLVIPTFYLYTLSVCYAGFKLKIKHGLHLIPFALTNIVFIPRFFLVSPEAKAVFFREFTTMAEAKFINVIISMQYVCYLIAAWFVLRKSRKFYLENYGEGTTHSYKWLFQLVALLAVAHGIVLVKNIFKFTENTQIFAAAQVISGVAVLFFLAWIVLNALYTPTIFRGVDPNLKLVASLLHKGKRVNSKFSESTDKEFKEKVGQLREYMLREEPYLDSSLSLNRLALQMKISSREMSILINHHLGQHFFDFVNEYRIKKAMQILKDPSKRKLTILEILYEVGFQSKSSFNTAFKKYTNLTPSQYRSSHLLQVD
ncbi:helix-turn-helix domain-containing protein [Xanthovirga aplysinae]|uniref:helix-turn-helix domain-containing protein n=1 Tax=Xanthovirga aplysinae TaxID=2529853 RepID=UPI0016574E38|nr:AraC family transcriptional regulator [Xanthovirga aplysinae]